MKLPNVEPNNLQLDGKTRSPSQKLKSAPLNTYIKTFNKKNAITSEKKLSSFSEDIDSHALMLGEIKQLETRLENQISKTNTLEKQLEELKLKIFPLKTELKLQQIRRHKVDNKQQ